MVAGALTGEGVASGGRMELRLGSVAPVLPGAMGSMVGLRVAWAAVGT